LVDRDQDRAISFFGRRLPSWVEVRIFAIPAGRERIYDAREWRNALVVIERGEIEMHCLNGDRSRFRRGDTLFLSGLPVWALRNNGHETALLCALSRGASACEPALVAGIAPMDAESESR
jgi:hypothetical protein